MNYVEYDVYWTEYPLEVSFMAETPYLVQAKFDNNDVWIMVDTQYKQIFYKQ
jgi:hypothetical protein